MIGPNGLAHPLIWARGMYPKAPSRFGRRVAVDKVRNLQYVVCTALIMAHTVASLVIGSGGSP